MSVLLHAKWIGAPPHGFFYLGRRLYRDELKCILISSGKGQLVAPARRWACERVRLTYLDYHAAHGRLGDAWRELAGIGWSDARVTASALGFLSRAVARRALSVAAGR